MEQIVVFNYVGYPAFTPYSNYVLRVMDASKINVCKNFDSLDELKGYLVAQGMSVKVMR